MELIALIVLIVLALALYGFIQLLIPIFSNSTSATEDDTSRQTGRQRELRDLSTAAKTIRQFLVWEMIDESEAEPVLRCIEERKEVLTERPRRPAKLTVPIDSSPSAKLKQLFHDCKDVRTLTPANQNLALILSSGLSYEELKQLPPGVLHHLGELFELVNRDRDALRVYRLLLESHPEYQNGVTVALSGAQLAKAHDNSELTNWFLNYLSRQELTAEQSFSVLELEANPEEEPVQVPILIEEHVQETPSTEEPTVEPEPIAEVPKPPAKPETPARSWSDTLAGFMEEKNILWGELVGGLLIVGCSIALVITLWQTLERIPYFPFLVFSTISLALFGAGKYTLHHWKLESTSRGLLLISTLLLPLNLLVLTGLSQGRSGGVLEIITAVGGTFVFAWMAISAGRTLTPALQSWLSLGVVGTAAMQLPIPFFPSWITSSQITFLALAPVLCMAIAVIMATNRTQSRVKEDTAPISTLYLFLGLAFFSLMIVLGLIISRGVNLRLMLQRLSLSFSLAGVPFVLSGLTLLRQLSKADQSPDLQEQRGQSLLIVTSIAFAGMLVMIVATLLAFPVPVLVLIIGLLNAASLSWLAFRTNFPPVHCAAIFCLTLAYFALFALGTPALTMTEFLELVNSTRQVGLVLGLLVIAEILLHRGARQHALYFAWSVLIVGAGAFAYLVKQRYPDLTTIGTMSLLYAALTGFSAIRWKQLWLGYLAHGLTLLGITTFVADSYPNEPYLWSLPLACHSLLLAIVALRASPVWHWPLTQPCRTIAVLSGLLSLIVILPALGESNVVLLLTPLLLGISTLCLVWNYEWSPGTWLAGVLFWLAFSHLYTHDLPANWVPLPTAASFLSLSALTLIGQQFIRHRAERAQSLFAKPFEGITIVGTIGALLILIGNLHESLILLAVYLTIIALLWLTISVQQQSAAWWAGFQSAIFGVVLLFTTDWLHHQEWAEWPWSFFDSRIWHTYAIALTFACILWSILAWSLRNQARIITLMRPSWRMIDQWIADGLLAFQALFVLSRLIPALAQELLPSEIDFGAFATSTDWHGATAWTFFGLLFLLFVLRLWSPQTRWTLHRLLLLALTLPFILTGNRLGTASLSQGLRWSLALTFLLLSVVFWARDIIRKWAEKLRISEQDISLITARSLLSGVCMGPVLLLTLALSPTAFELVDYGLPILVVIVTLVGHALRESDSEFAFAAGLILVVFVPLGHLLHSLQLTDSWTLIESVRLVRLGALMSGSWALLWLSTRRWQKVWNEPSQLMTIQIGITVAGLTILLCSGLFSIVLGMSSTIGHALTAEVGALWSWLTVTVTLGAWVLRHEQRGLVISWNGVGVIALGLVGFLSCTVDAIAPDWGYRTLLVGLSLCALLWSLAQFLPTKTVSPNQATSWITGIGSAVILLSFKGLIVEESLYWSAGAIMVLSASTALLARWRAEELWAFISTLAMSLAVSLIVWEINPGHSNAQLWVYLLQANATVFAVLSLLWSLETWERKTLFTFQSWAGVSILIFLLGYALVLIVSSPDVLLPEEVQIMGYPLGWIALTLSGWAVWKRSQSDIPIMLGIMIVVMTAIVIHGQSTIPWTGLHVVQIGFAALGAFCAVSIQRRSSYLIWTQAFIWMLVGLGFRSAWTDPWQPWPGVGTALLASGLAGSIAIVLRRQSFVNLSAIFIVLSGAQFWLGGQQIITIEFIPALLIALSAAVLIWTVIELQLSKREPPYTLREDRISQPPFTHSGSWLASISLAIVAVGVLFNRVVDIGFLSVSSHIWIALALLWVGLLLLQFDRTASSAPANLYFIGVVTLAMFLAHSPFTPWATLQWAMLGLAGCVLIVSVIVRGKLWTPPAVSERQQTWFIPTQAVLSGIVFILSFPISCTMLDLSARLTAPLCLVMLLCSWLLLGNWIIAKQTLLQRWILYLFPLILIETGWAMLNPLSSTLLAHRMVVAVLGLSLTGLLYHAPLQKLLPSSWQPLTHRLSYAMIFGGVLSLIVLISQEFSLYDRVTKTTSLFTIEVYFVLIGILFLMGMLIRFAVTAREDPFGLRVPSEEGAHNDRLSRTVYVYLCEVLLVVLFLHIKLNLPFLFSGRISKYWTIILIGVAYLGIGLGEYFRRRGLTVLAGPLQRTGMFLPLIPLLAFWLRPPAALLGFAERSMPGTVPLLNYLYQLPMEYEKYALIWLMLSGLYFLLAMLRKSSIYAWIAALASNFSLWSLWLHFEVSFLIHPQIWLIPLALILLLSEQIHKEQLSSEQRLTLRYFGLMLIYLSSTADLFLVGVGESVWMPIVLALLSVLGVFTGILLRIRAFLYFGVGFLCLDIFTMIWHAAVNRQQTWIWYVSGIILGGLILTMFALFEKRKNDVLAAIDKFKQWD